MMLDAVDLEILRILQEDSRMPYSEIAAKANISRPTAKARIKKLQSRGIIKKFTVIIDRDAIVQNIVVLIQMRAENPEDACKALQGMEEILEIYEVMGERNLACKAIVQSMAEMRVLMERINALDVRDLSASLVLKTIKEEHEKKVGPEIGVSLECEYCGKAIAGPPHKFKVHNVEHYFCCPLCLKTYKKRIRRAPR
jgi:DNA-binding Lrp family transcriptional regulator